MLPHKARHYLLEGLTAAPVVLDSLLEGATDSQLDRRPVADRFTLREAIAHLADWEGVWLERITRMRDEENPALPGYDEGQWAIDHDYASLDAREQLARFRDGRARLLETLRALAPEQWERPGLHGEVGPITIETLSVLILGHDGYHARQAAEWMK